MFESGLLLINLSFIALMFHLSLTLLSLIFLLVIHFNGAVSYSLDGDSFQWCALGFRKHLASVQLQLVLGLVAVGEWTRFVPGLPVGCPVQTVVCARLVHTFLYAALSDKSVLHGLYEFVKHGNRLMNQCDAEI